jgi:hypothetical protein
MQAYWDADAEIYSKTRQMPWRTLWRLADATSKLLGGTAQVLLLPLTLSFLLCRLPRVRMVVIVGGVCAFGFLLQKYSQAHYLAPLTGIILLLAMFGLRLIRAANIRGNDIGLYLMSCIVVISVGAAALDMKRAIVNRYSPNAPPSPLDFRWEAEKSLSETGGLHLIIVRYRANHNPHVEFVYNGPDIDDQKVVWAFDRGSIANQDLLRYYRGRQFWLLDADTLNLRIDHYNETENLVAP